nr:hypothetical protein [Tanacetum cinerariifolium]
MAELLSIEYAHASREYIASLSMSIAVRRWYGLSQYNVLTRDLRRARSNWTSSKRTSNSSVLCLTVVSSSVTLSLTPSKVVGAIYIILSTISSHASVIPDPAYSTLHLLRSDSVGHGCLAVPAAELSLISNPRVGVPSGAPVSVGLVVRGDGKGNGRDGIGSGGESKAACLAMHASMDADMGGSGLTVFRALRRRVWEKEILIGDPGACVGSSASNASVSPAERTRSTIGTSGESAEAGCSSSSSSSSSKGSSSGSSSSVLSSSSSEGSSSPSPPSAG